MAMGWNRKFVAAVVGTTAPVWIPLARGMSLRILNYHRIIDPDSIYPLDIDVVSADPDLFDRQVKFCARHFDVMSFRDLDDAAAGRLSLPARPLIMTFDDGYEDNYRLAFPVLRRHGVPAMFFLAADYIDTTRRFWWDDVSLALATCAETHLDVQCGQVLHRLDLSTAAARRSSTRFLLRRLKDVDDSERVRVLGELSQVADRRFDAHPRQTLTWDEVREMHAAGMEIGSHTLSHPILSRVRDDDALQHEIAGSKVAIERMLGSPVSVFSYPVGGQSAINGRVRDVVQASGYKYAVTYINGINRLAAGEDRFAMRRLHVDGLNESEFRMRLVAPHL